jgi:hypothetical protein
MADRTIVTDLLTNRNTTATELGRTSKAADKSHGMLRKLGGGAKFAGAALAGAAVGGVALLTKFTIDGVKSAQDHQTVLLKSAAVIKSTGNAAGISVKGIESMSATLETMSGVDEDLISNSQNVLATFTNIRNVGKDRIFDKATKSALDMSAALGTDLQGASILVGKALNDPIKGMTALSRSGVSFTQKQKDVVKHLVDTGQTVKAQKLILGELNKEFGGAAKAAGSGFAGSMARAQDAVADAGRSVGVILLPYLTRFANWVATKGVPAVVSFAKWAGPKLVVAWNATRTAAMKVGAFFTGTLWPAIEQGRKIVMPLLKFAMDNVKKGFGDLTSTGIDFKGLAVTLWPVLKTIGIVIGAVVVVAITSMSMQFRAAAFVIKNVIIPAIKFLIRVALQNFGDMLDTAVIAFGWIPGLGPKLKTAQRQFHTFRDSVNRSLDGIKDERVNVIVGYKTVLSDKGAKTASKLYHFAKGGIVKARAGGTLAVIGEAGQDEAVVPLPKGGRTGGRGLPGLGGTLIVNLTIGAGADPRQTAEWMDQVFRQAEARGFRPSKLRTA